MNLYSLFRPLLIFEFQMPFLLKRMFLLHNFLPCLFQADSLKKSLKGSSGNGGGCSLDSKMQQVKELEEEVNKYFSIL